MKKKQQFRIFKFFFGRKIPIKCIFVIQRNKKIKADKKKLKNSLEKYQFFEWWKVGRWSIEGFEIDGRNFMMTSKMSSKWNSAITEICLKRYCIKWWNISIIKKRKTQSRKSNSMIFPLWSDWQRSWSIEELIKSQKRFQLAM